MVVVLRVPFLHHNLHHVVAPELPTLRQGAIVQETAPVPDDGDELHLHILTDVPLEMGVLALFYVV